MPEELYVAKNCEITTFKTGKYLHSFLQEQLYTEAVVQSCSVKKVSSEISQNSQENTCARVSFLITLQASVLQLY